MAIGFVDNAISLYFMSFMDGFVGAIFSAQRTEVPFEFVPAVHMANAVGIILFCEYTGLLLGPVMHGLLWAKFGTYSIGFIIGDFIFAFASLLMLMDFIRLECCSGNY